VSDAVVMLQILTQDEQVLTMQTLVLQSEVDELVCLDIMQGHVPSVDGQAFYSVFEHELCQVLQAELVHLRVLEVDQLWNSSLAEVLVRQDRMSNDLSQDTWSLLDVLHELGELFSEQRNVLEPMLGILMKQLN